MTRLKVNAVLADDEDITVSVRNAFLNKEYTPVQIALAAKTRYVGRVMRALRSRPDPEAPVLLCSDTYYTETPAVLKAKLTTYLDTARDFALSRGRIQGTLVDTNYFRSPILGFCVAATHVVQYHASTGKHLPLRYLGVPPASFGAWQRAVGLCPEDYPSLSCQLLCVCPQHNVRTCCTCEARCAMDTLDAQGVLDYVVNGNYCARCIARGWLSEKKPPRLNAHAVKLWRANVREFVETI